MLNDQAEVQRIFAIVKNINIYYLRQLAQASLEHNVLTKIGAYSHTIIVQKEIQNKTSSDSTQQYIARIFEARILDDINKSNHVQVNGVNNLDLSPN